MEGLNQSNCSYISEKELDQLSLIRGVGGIMYLMVCCFTLLLILYYHASGPLYRDSSYVCPWPSSLMQLLTLYR